MNNSSLKKSCHNFKFSTRPKHCKVCNGDGTSCTLSGDTNFDGIVDILDIVRIVNQIMDNLEFNDDEFTAADFNADDIVDILDIVQIINYILDI